jgi:hypothetical protein
MIKIVNPIDGHFINFIVPHVKTEGNLYDDHYILYINSFSHVLLFVTRRSIA